MDTITSTIIYRGANQHVVAYAHGDPYDNADADIFHAAVHDNAICGPNCDYGKHPHANAPSNEHPDPDKPA